MIKLYKIDGTAKDYWEYWDNDDGTHTVHCGPLGSTGQSTIVKPSLFKRSASKVRQLEAEKRAQGYKEIDLEEHQTLLIEYVVDGHGTGEDVEKRHKLEDRMNETLGWAGLGACDGGSIGSGSMEVCCFVVDFEIAKKVIAKDLNQTDFGDYQRIYDEDAE